MANERLQFDLDQDLDTIFTKIYRDHRINVKFMTARGDSSGLLKATLSYERPQQRSKTSVLAK